MKVITAALIIVAVTVPAASGAGKANGGSTSAGGTAAVGGSKAAGGKLGTGGVTARGGAGGYSGVGGVAGAGGRTASGGTTIAAGHSGVSGTTGSGGHNARWRHGRVSIGIGIGMMAIPWIWKLSALLPALALLILSARFAAPRPTLKGRPMVDVDAATEPENPGATSLTRVKTPDYSRDRIAR